MKVKKYKSGNANTNLLRKGLSASESNLMSALESLMPEKSTGGQLLATGLSFLPGVGSALGPAVGILDGLFGSKAPVLPVPKANINSNPFGNLNDGGVPCKDCGGKLTEVMKKGGWIQKAVNPEHKGYCTPMTKSTCTPRRKAFAMTMKKHHGFHKEDGGPFDNMPPIDTVSTAQESTMQIAPSLKEVDKTVMNVTEMNRLLNDSRTMNPVDKQKTYGEIKRLASLNDAFYKKDGGVINQGFKQYDTGSHDSGNDLKVDQYGNPTNNPVAAVQNQENAVIIEGKPYVMSDTLINPETGNTFNIDAAMVNKKHPKASQLEEDKNTMDFKMKRLASLNTLMKSLKDSFNKAEGGPFVPRRIDPLTGAESNLISDAPEYDPMSENFDKLPQADYTPEFMLRGINPSLPDNTKVNAPDILIGNSDNQSYSPQEVSQRGLPEGNDINYNAIAIGLKGAGLVKSLVDSLTPAEKESPILPNYNKSDKYMQEANIDYTQARQDAIGASNVGANVNRSASGNFSAFANREQSRVANLSDSISRIDQQENNARSSLNLSRGQYEQGKAVDTANRLTQNRINNQQNQANADFADQKLFSELGQVGSEFNKYQNFREQLANNKELQNYYINEALTILNSKNANFQIDPDFVNKLKSGAANIDDIIKVVNMTGINIEK